MPDVINLADHPKRIESIVKDLASDLDKVSFSANINDLARARHISMNQIWACLECGSILEPQWISRNPNGLYGKMAYRVGGDFIEVDFMIANGELHVLYATRQEE